MAVIAVVLFMTGTMSTIVGAAQALAAARSGLTAAEERSPIRRSAPTVLWSVIAVYGLLLASSGISLAR